MARLSHDVIKAAFLSAFKRWQESGNRSATARRLFHVQPRAHYPQTGIRLTGFATAFFAELCLQFPQVTEFFVAYKGVLRPDQPSLRKLIELRIPNARVTKRERLSLDFSAVSRSKPTEPWCVSLAVESEMKPISGQGEDPERLVPDLVKLCQIEASTKVFLCRVNGGKEKIGDTYVPKQKRIAQVLEATMYFAKDLRAVGKDTELASVMMVTGESPPWRVQVKLLELPACDGSRSVTTSEFSLGDGLPA